MSPAVPERRFLRVEEILTHCPLRANGVPDYTAASQLGRQTKVDAVTHHRPLFPPLSDGSHPAEPNC